MTRFGTHCLFVNLLAFPLLISCLEMKSAHRVSTPMHYNRQRTLGSIRRKISSHRFALDNHASFRYVNSKYVIPSPKAHVAAFIETCEKFTFRKTTHHARTHAGRDTALVEMRPCMRFSPCVTSIQHETLVKEPQKRKKKPRKNPFSPARRLFQIEKKKPHTWDCLTLDILAERKYQRIACTWYTKAATRRRSGTFFNPVFMTCCCS
jgi:hypothetical protein